MNTFLLFTRLYQLRCCNKVIISLYDRHNNADEISYKICIERLEKRLKITTELEDIISKLRNQKGLLAEKSSFYLISSILNSISRVTLVFQSKKLDEIRKWENKNLHLYYLTLYIPDAPKLIVDILLEQKKEIEDLMTIKN